MRSFVRTSLVTVALATSSATPLQAQHWSQQLNEHRGTAAFVGGQFRLPFGREASPQTALQLGFTHRGHGTPFGRGLQASLVELGMSANGTSMKLAGVEMHRRDVKLGVAQSGGGGGAGMLLLGGLAIAGGAAVLASGDGSDSSIRDRGRACPAIYPPLC